MTKFNRSRLEEIFARFKNQRVAILGDLMLDRYMWGGVQRISPEAPVPVVEVTSETVKLGGAANVANNILTLGAQTIPMGVVGNDRQGVHMRELFVSMGMEIDCVVTDEQRPTTIKTRIIANDQHVVRADVESKDDLSPKTEDELLTEFKKKLPNIDGVIIEDYNKGVITPRLIREVISLCNETKTFVAVDPKFKNFFSYKGVTLFKPNLRETEQALGLKIDSDEELQKAARELFTRIKCKSILITRSEKGMTLFPASDEQTIHVPTQAKKIHDVSGAGDTVIATLMVSCLAGATLHEAAIIANYAAAAVCVEVGVIPIDRELLWNELTKNGVV